jgi:predicted DNA-binding protein
LTTPNKHCSVRLDRSKYDRLVALATERGCTPSDLLRTAVDNFLSSGHLLTSSQRRLARIGEFQQLALDIIIREQFPEYRDRIIAETDKRLELYHGA